MRYNNMKRIFLFLSLILPMCLYAQVTITMEQEAGVYKVPCVVNGAKMKFIFDTGAATVCLSETMAEYLLDNEYISKEDFIGTGTSTVADGRTVSHLKIILKDIEIGGLHLKDVEASIVEGQRAPLLLGQTAIQKLGKVSIDGNQLTIDNGINEDVDVAIECLRVRCQLKGGLSEVITFDKFKKILNDDYQLKSYFDYTKQKYPSLFNMSWDEFKIERSKLLRSEENKLVSPEELTMRKLSVLEERARKYEEQKQFHLAAESWKEYYNLSVDNGYAYIGQGENAYNVGENYYEAKEYNKAISWLTKGANKGYSDAQYLLGLMYFNGEGCEKNTSTAVYWYRKSAEQDHAGAQCNLGYCYVNGIGVSENIFDGFDWTRKAYKNGSNIAEENLSSYFRDFKLMAENGNTTAAFYLGLCYENGYGTSQNYYEAIKWYNVSANSGSPAGMNNLAYLSYYGLGTSVDKVSAICWWKKASENGNLNAQISLAQCYYGGDGIEKDYLSAFHWYSRAAEQGDLGATCKIGEMLLYGQGVKTDYTKAITYFENAAKKEHEEAYYILGNLYWQGFGVKQNFKEAVDWWYKCSFDYRHKRGVDYLIATAWRDGKGRDKDIQIHQVWMNYCKSSPEGLNELAYDLAIGRNGWEKQHSQALAVIDEAIKINPNDPNFYDSKGEFYSMQNNFEKAKEMWLKVKSIDSAYYIKNDTELNKYIKIHSN